MLYMIPKFFVHIADIFYGQKITQDMKDVEHYYSTKQEGRKEKKKERERERERERENARVHHTLPGLRTERKK